MFPYDIVLSADDICNLTKEADIVKRHTFAGRKISIFGRRNTGKTSVVESIIIPAFRKKYRNSFVLVVDLMGVLTLDDIEVRLAKAFERAFKKAFPAKAKFQEMVAVIKGIQPGVSVNQQGEWGIQLAGWQSHDRHPKLDEIFSQLRNIHAASHKLLLVMDEFQDVSFVEQAEALLRNEIQRLAKDIPVILMGSKKHILTTMFSDPQSPFFNWGEPVEFGEIAYEEYHDYMQQRFRTKKIKIPLAVATYIQDLMQRIPEPINILCSYLYDSLPQGETIDKEKVDESLAKLTTARRSKMEEYLTRFTSAEMEVLIALAKLGRVKHPSGKEFLDKLKVSKPGVSKVLKKFLDQAIVYSEPDGVELADPLLAQHLKVFR